MLEDIQRITFAHRKPETNEFKNIKDALTWADPKVENEDKNRKLNSRWLTENKDKFRHFIPGSDVLSIQGVNEDALAADPRVDSFENVLNESNDRIEVAPIQKKTVKIF